MTGVSVEKRPDFCRLLSDCRKGLIDRILVKSISRFARNTTECLETIRELKSIGVSVYFEEQNIDTGKMSGEFLTAMFAAMAQKESQTISENMRWSYQKRIQSGNFNTCKAPFGYRIEEKTLKVHCDEAEVVRFIFQSYLSGASKNEILKALRETVAPEKSWSRRTVEYILKNERYAGNALLQKKYTTDTLPRKLVYNHGERNMYFVEGVNSEIITQDCFDKAQTLRTRRTARRTPSNQAHPLSRKVVCGQCGCAFRPRTVREKEYMVCRQHDENAHICTVLPIAGEQFYQAFLRLYYKLKHGGKRILKQMFRNLMIVRERQILWNPDIIELNQQISFLYSQNQLLANMKKEELADYVTKSVGENRSYEFTGE